MTAVIMRVICFSSGAWPCGIANYHRHLVPYLESRFSVRTELLPTNPVLRDRPLALAGQRRRYARLAGLTRAHDVALLQFVTFWNGSRPGENMLPVFVEALDCPTVVVLHEWPAPMQSDPPNARWTSRLARATVARAAAGAEDFDAWLGEVFFQRMSHFIVHSTELRDRLVQGGVPLERITVTLHPVYETGDAPDGELQPSLVERIGGRRVMLLFGFPHPRKNYELAIRALHDMPPDVVLVMAGATDGAFRSAYVEKLVALATERGVADRFHMTGEIGEQALRSLFARTSVAVAPFSYATGSGSIAYFLGAGLPVVASDIPSNAAVADAGAGLSLFRRDDAGDLVRAVTGVLSDSTERDRLRAQSTAFARLHNFDRLGHTIADTIRIAAGSREAVS